MPNPTYINNKGAIVSLTITPHAKLRFSQRWQHAYPDITLPKDNDKILTEWFIKAKRIEPKSDRYKERLKRHGKDSLYFSASPFLFVVQSAKIVTVELDGKDMRHLNKIKPEKTESLKSPKIEAKAFPKKFEVTACLIHEGTQKFVSLGRYDSSQVKGRAELLRTDEAFLQECKTRLYIKDKPGELISIHVRLGDKVTVVYERLDSYI